MIAVPGCLVSKTLLRKQTKCDQGVAWTAKGQGPWDEQIERHFFDNVFDEFLNAFPQPLLNTDVIVEGFVFTYVDEDITLYRRELCNFWNNYRGAHVLGIE